ncbi:MAG: sensor histidine kinase [Betaproteobacteria bacterium]
MSATPTMRSVSAWSETPVPGISPATREPDRPRAALRQLVGLRTVAIVAQVCLVLAAVELLDVELPIRRIFAVLTALALFNGWACYRLRARRPVTDLELLLQLIVDMVALTAVLALSGGAANPFGGIVLLPLATGATLLSWRAAWTLGAASMVCYSLLLWTSHPLLIHAPEVDGMLMLSAGMWVSYCLTAVVIVGVLLRVTYALRRDEQIIEEARRKEVFDAHIERIGALAAGAAHELSSPLASIAMIVEDLRREPLPAGEVDKSLELVSRLLANCRETLCGLLSYGNSTLCSSPEQVKSDDFIRTCVESFAVRRPDCSISFKVESHGQPPTMLANRALRQALTSILDNAADASPQRVEVSIGWDAQWLRIRVRDHGPGICADVMDALGKLMFITTKESGKGNGLGLYLANTAVSRFGGSLSLSNAADCGAIAEIVLPVSEAVPLERGSCRQ